jgi:hypothetical protein
MRRALLVVVLVGTWLIQTPAEAVDTRTVRYGPYTIPAGTMDMPGSIDRVKLAVKRPCWDCFITGFKANLTYPDGSTANYNTGAMIHHVVQTSQWRGDPTCNGTVWGLAGERFFASGNERTPLELPAGYGYRVRWYDSWNMLLELENMEPMEQTVYVDITYSVAGSSSSLKPVKPVWLDIDNCNNSEYEIPAGPDVETWDWNVNVEGHLVSIAGHLHDHGVQITARNETTGQDICTSVAGYGNVVEYMGHLSSMSTCKGTPQAVLDSGDLVRIYAEYNSPEPRDDVMGIMLGYIHKTPVG